MSKSVKDILTEWRGIAKEYGSLSKRAHSAAVDALVHFKEHGDTSLFTKIMKLVRRKGFNSRALLQWFEKHALCRTKVIGDDVVFYLKKRAKHTLVDVDRAAAMPFYDDEAINGQTNKDAKTFSVYGRIKTLLRKENEAMQEYTADPKAFKSAPVTLIKSDRQILEKMIARWEQEKAIEAPQPKSDKPLFDVATATPDAPKKLAAVGE